MVIDLTKLCEDELIELNQRIVERLQLIRSAKSLTLRSQCKTARHDRRFAARNASTDTVRMLRTCA
jgi:hypothetical protein